MQTTGLNDATLVRHRQFVFLRDRQKFSSEVTRPGEDCDITVLRQSKFAVLLDLVGVIPHDLCIFVRTASCSSSC